MSIGGTSALGTLLVQRLDAVLGTTLSQQTNLISGARPDAVSQPADAEKTEGGRDELVRHPQESVDKNQGRIQGDGRDAVEKSSLSSRQLENAARLAADTGSTSSAPTRLGYTARTILALLAEFPEQAPPVSADTALFDPDGAHADPRPGTPTAPGGTASGSAPGASTAGTANASSGTPYTAAGTSRPAGSQPPPASAAGAQATGAPPAPPGMASALAHALAQALEQSGLFYESHLADLAFGKRGAGDLSPEPQARLSPGSPGTQPGQAGATASTPQAAASPSVNASAGAPSHSTAGAAPGSNPAQPAQASAGTTALPAAAVLPYEAHLVVRQQLETLANQAFAWQGPAWPGAPMRWAVARHEHPASEDPAATPPYWSTHVRITLPRLGLVDASLTLAGPRIAVRLTAPEGAPALQDKLTDLRSRLSAAGLSPGDIFVATGPDEHGLSGAASASDETFGHGV